MWRRRNAPRRAPRQRVEETLPGFAKEKPRQGKGAEKKLGGQQGSGRGREGNIKLMSTTGSCEGAPGRGRDIKLMPTTRLRGNEGVGNMPKEHQTGRASNLIPSTKEPRPSCSYGTTFPKHLLKGRPGTGHHEVWWPHPSQGYGRERSAPPVLSS